MALFDASLAACNGAKLRIREKFGVSSFISAVSFASELFSFFLSFFRLFREEVSRAFVSKEVSVKQ